MALEYVKVYNSDTWRKLTLTLVHTTDRASFVRSFATTDDAD